MCQHRGSMRASHSWVEAQSFQQRMGRPPLCQSQKVAWTGESPALQMLQCRTLVPQPVSTKQDRMLIGGLVTAAECQLWRSIGPDTAIRLHVPGAEWRLLARSNSSLAAQPGWTCRVL